MSSITSLISAGGGGGGETNIVTDPRKLPRIAASNFYTKVDYSANVLATDVGFYTTYLPQSDAAAYNVISANDTYVTLIDVSNSFGGFLHWVLSPEITTTNNISTVKITIDGQDPVELSYQYSNIVGTPGGNRARMIVGGGWSTGKSATSPSNAAGSVMFNNNYTNNGFSIYGDSVQNWDDPVNKVYGSGNVDVYYNNTPGTQDQVHFPKLRFNSALKVEVKQQTVSTSDNGHYSACLYTLH